jgi:hypothetical protein
MHVCHRQVLFYTYIILITTGFLDFVHRPEFYKQENTTFRKLDLFPSSGEGGTYSIRNFRKNLP